MRVHRSAHRVVRVSIACVEQQIAYASLILYERYGHFDELFINRQAIVERHRRRTEAGQKSAQLARIGLKGHEVGAMLVADIDPDAVRRCRQLDAVLAEFSGYVRMNRSLRNRAERRTREIK